MEGRATAEVNTPKKRLCSRVAQVAEAGPDGVQVAMPKRSRVRATQGTARAEHAIGEGVVFRGRLVSLITAAYGCAILAGLLVGLQWECTEAHGSMLRTSGEMERQTEITVST